MGKDVWTVGFHAVLGVLESNQPVDALWIQKGRHDRKMQRIKAAARKLGIRYDLVPRTRLDGVADGVAHNGCAVRSAPVAFVELDELVRADGEESRLLLVDDLKDPQNLGAVLRTAAALSIGGVVIAGPSAPPLGGAVAKAAAGLLGRVPLARASVAADALSQLRERGYWAFAADVDGAPLHEVRHSQRWVLCIGAEERGLRAKTRSKVDEFVAIPMAKGVESLILSVSAGILLWELSKAKS